MQGFNVLAFLAGVVFCYLALLSFQGWYLAALRNFTRDMGICLALTACISEFLLVVQALSLMGWLNAGAILLGYAGMAISKRALVGWDLWLHLPSMPELWHPVRTGLQVFRPDRGNFPEIAATIVFLLGIVVLAALGMSMQPIGDSYHFTRPLYWIQHASIAHFPINNYRVNALAPGPDILTIPFELFLNTFYGRVILAAVSLPLVVLLARRLAIFCGSGRKEALIAAVCVGSATFALNGVFYGWSDMLLPAVFVLLSACLLLEAANRGVREGAWIYGMAAFSAIFAAGMKNTALAILPGLAVVAVVTGGMKVFKVRTISIVILSAVAGALCSGMAWNYGSNLAFYGSPLGPPEIKEDTGVSKSVADCSVRVTRGLLHLADFTYTPGPLVPIHQKAKSRIADFLGASRALPGEREGSARTFDARDTNDRKGFGWPGLIALAGCAAYIVLLVAGRKTDPGNWRAALVLPAAGVLMFIAVHAMVAWFEHGRLRFVYPGFVLLAPCLALVLVNHTARTAVVILVSLHTAVLVAKSGVFAIENHQAKQFLYYDGSVTKPLRQPEKLARLVMGSQVGPWHAFDGRPDAYRMLADVLPEGSRIGL